MIVGRIISISLKALKPTYFHSCLQQKMGYIPPHVFQVGSCFLHVFFKKIHECITMFQEEIHTNLLFKVKALRLLDLCTDVFLTVWNPNKNKFYKDSQFPDT